MARQPAAVVPGQTAQYLAMTASNVLECDSNTIQAAPAQAASALSRVCTAEPREEDGVIVG
ncbi:MAG: hypothetical protein WCG47_09200 [Dermatophilaceae bacterium]